MSLGPNHEPVINATTQPLPKKLVLWCVIAIIGGLAGAGLTASQSTERAMANFLQNSVFWLGVSQGGFMLAVAMTLTKARWGRSLKRIAEAFGLFVPVVYVGIIAFLALGGIDIFPWMHEDLPYHKKIYLTEPFFFWRQVGGLGLLIVLNLLYLRASWRPDLGVMKEKLGDAAPGWWSFFTKNWTDADNEIECSEDAQRTRAVLIAITYSLVFSVAAVDLSMSLSPHWFANMFPAWFFMSSMWSGLVGIGIYSLLAGRWLKIDHHTTPNVYHDLGKLIFAFCMFWAYTTYAQYLAIWYGNMTEETGFILLRTSLEPWASLSKVVVVLCFIAPWTMLLSRGMKKIRSGFLTVAFLLFIGIWLERFLVMIPSVWRGDDLPLGVGEVLMALGFGGAMVLVVSWFLSKIPAAPITDKMFEPNDLEIHIHPSHGHAAK